MDAISHMATSTSAALDSLPNESNMILIAFALSRTTRPRILAITIRGSVVDLHARPAAALRHRAQSGRQRRRHL
eukprot:6123448-Pyramimonas_sp.AAC.1